MSSQKLRKRPVQILKEDDLKPENLENINRHFDDRVKELDMRRINQVTTLADSATLANVITKLNELLGLLNGSDLTED